MQGSNYDDASNRRFKDYLIAVACEDILVARNVVKIFSLATITITNSLTHQAPVKYFKPIVT